MWFSGPDGTSVPKGALRICEERGLPNVENMMRDELRALLSSQPDFSSVKPGGTTRCRASWPHSAVWPKMPSRVYACRNVLGTCEKILQTALWT